MNKSIKEHSIYLYKITIQITIITTYNYYIFQLQ